MVIGGGITIVSVLVAGVVVGAIGSTGEIGGETVPGIGGDSGGGGVASGCVIGGGTGSDIFAASGFFMRKLQMA